MIQKLILNFRMLLLVAAALSVMGLGVFVAGFVTGKNSVINKELKDTVDKVVTQKEIQIQIQRMPKNEVQKLLEQKWCRDCQ